MKISVFYLESFEDVAVESCFVSSFAIASISERALLLRSSSSALTYLAPLEVTYILGRSSSNTDCSRDFLPDISSFYFEFYSIQYTAYGLSVGFPGLEKSRATRFS